MRKLIVLAFVFMVFGSGANTQNTLTPAPLGFDIVRRDIPHGKIDSVIIIQKQSVHRKALIYTPPDFSKIKNTRFSIYCMASVAMKRNGSQAVSPR